MSIKTTNNKPNHAKAHEPNHLKSESKLQKLVKKNPHFEFIENGKVRCTLTQHEFLPILENYQNYISSKSYKKGLESEFDISEYEDYLVPHKISQHFLFCKLTESKLPKKKTAILKHVNSKRFKKLFAESKPK